MVPEMSFFSESLMFQSPDPSELPVPNFEAGSKSTIIMARSYKSIDGEDNVGSTVEETSTVVALSKSNKTIFPESVGRNTADLVKVGQHVHSKE